jgi:alpha-galactosidase
VPDVKIRKTIDALTSRSRTVGGKPTSLADLGFNHLGIDDGRQACGTGYKGSFHAADGTPMVNKTKFPDLKSLVDYGHAKGSKMGW